jgi:hypothetical protein
MICVISQQNMLRHCNIPDTNAPDTLTGPIEDDTHPMIETLPPPFFIPAPIPADTPLQDDTEYAVPDDLRDMSTLNGTDSTDLAHTK